jgi:succinoglycan biosynthesis protein ExoO
MQSNLNHKPRHGPQRVLTISVAIATYNRAAMVPAAIRAALEQSRPPIEVVVADDASTDSTGAVVTHLAET